MIYYGGAPVPWTVMWSGEDRYHVAECPAFHLLAICQNEAPGGGKPKFGRPHTIRQRRAVKERLCDLCAKPLRDATKVSLSNVGVSGRADVLQVVEPMLHRECAKTSLELCPALRRQIRERRIQVRQVFAAQPQATIASSEEMERFVPDYRRAPLLGLAITCITAWRDRDAAWLTR